MTGTSGWRTSASPTVASAAVDDVDDALRHACLVEELDEALRRASGVSVAGLKTTVLPQTSAGAIFHDGIAIGKFHGVITPTTPIGMRTRHVELVPELRRRRLPEQATPLAGHVEAHVDRFLDVAPGLGLHLPHLVGHEVGQLVLLVGDELREAEEDLAALRCGHEPPVRVRVLRGRDGAIDVLGARAREGADQLAVGRARRIEGLARGGVDPLAADVVLVGACLRGRHAVSLSPQSSAMTADAYLHPRDQEYIETLASDEREAAVSTITRFRRPDRLRVGDALPHLELLRCEDARPVRLESLVGRRPLLLVFGSFT